MRVFLILTVVAAALAHAGAAVAGCWATVGLAPPPQGIAAGETWTAEITVLQHGRNPLPDAEDARPRFTIQNDATGERRTFTARPNGEPGVYNAQVVFPSAGAWRYEVFDGFTSWDGQPAPCAQTHAFAAVSIGGTGDGGSGPADRPTGGSGSPLWPWLGAAFAAFVVLAAGALLLRRRSPLRPTRV
jgi:LPXTG-motif cell wall-anchored protein